MRKKFQLLILIILVSLFISCPAARGKNIKAVKVLDGDTIILNDGRHIRYIGINAPEISHDGRPAQKKAVAALLLNRNLVMGKKLTLVFDHDKKDHYGRTLAYIFLPDKTFVNGRIVEKGLAFCLPFKNNNKYSELLLNLQKQAIKNKLGIWKNLDNVKGSFTGNKKSLRFHSEKCRFGKKINPVNRLYFKTLKQAFLSGMAPCKKCLGYWPK